MNAAELLPGSFGQAVARLRAETPGCGMAAHLLTRTGAATGSTNQLAAASGTDGRASAGPVVLTTQTSASHGA